jgi:hypothetical protein
MTIMTTSPSLRDAFVLYVLGIPEGELPRVFAAALDRYTPATSGLTHTATSSSAGIQWAATDRPAAPAEARRSRIGSLAEVDAKRQEYIGTVRMRILEIIWTAAAPMSEAEIVRKLGDKQKLHAAEAIADLKELGVLVVVALNFHRNPMYWFAGLPQG